jgi:hypothetical protein
MATSLIYSSLSSSSVLPLLLEPSLVSVVFSSVAPSLDPGAPSVAFSDVAVVLRTIGSDAFCFGFSGAGLGFFRII